MDTGGLKVDRLGHSMDTGLMEVGGRGRGLVGWSIGNVRYLTNQKDK